MSGTHIDLRPSGGSKPVHGHKPCCKCACTGDPIRSQQFRLFMCRNHLSPAPDLDKY